MREPIISFKDYTYHYRAQAEPTIYHINLEIFKGERIIIVGPSGCGKSTLAHCLNGLNPFSYPGESTGTLTICGVDAAKSSIFELSQSVGTVLQDTDGQFIGMTVLEDIAFSMENDCVPKEEMIRRTYEEAGKVSLVEKLEAAPHELSGGQKDGEKTVIIIEHRLEDAMHMGADRIILMENGRIISDSAPEELFLSDRLIKAGIREPLYLTALKYAGIHLTGEMHVERMQDLMLEENHKEQIRKWFAERKAKEPAKEKPEVLRVDGICFGYTPEKERAAHIGYVMQNPNQMISKPMIFEEVAMSLTLQKLPEEEIKQRVYDTLKICGLYEFRNWPVSALSYGQKKRVTIASILVANPKILILDEPTAGQDFRHYTEIMEFLRELNEKGITVLMITHDMHLMLEYTERSLVFADGRKIADTTPQALFSDPALLKRASLKETSLYELAKQCDLPPESYIRAFIEYDREVRA